MNSLCSYLLFLEISQTMIASMTPFQNETQSGKKVKHIYNLYNIIYVYVYIYIYIYIYVYLLTVHLALIY